MIAMVERIKFLERRGTLRVLLALQEKELTISNLLTIGIGSQAIYRSLDILQGMGLVDEKRGRYNARIIFLTEKGVKVVQHLEEIIKIVTD